jgi:hypothetical protein
MKELIVKMQKSLQIRALKTIADDLSIEVGTMDQRWETLSDQEKEYMDDLLDQISTIQEKIKQLKNPKKQ